MSRPRAAIHQDLIASKGGSPVRKSFLTFCSPRIEQDEIDEVTNCLRTGWLSTGPKVQQFEEDFKKYIGSQHAIAVNSCTGALHLALLAAGIGHGDEVITTPFTFAATTNAIEHVGAKPVFVDVDPATMNINVDLLKQKITRRTRAILPVHFAGRPCDMHTILALARKHELTVVEDAAHALEATYHGRKIGTLGDFTCFSFYATKNLTTGEGGMITTASAAAARKIRLFALHGMNRDAWSSYSDKGFKRYRIIAPGFKYNMMDIQAAIGIHQLRKIEAYLRIRESIWHRYDEAFRDLPVRLPALPQPGCRHARHLYTVVLNLGQLKVQRDQILEDLYNEGIGAGVHFISLHLHPYYIKNYGFKSGDFPQAASLSRRILSLPLSAKLTHEDVEDVITAFKKVLRYRWKAR